MSTINDLADDFLRWAQAINRMTQQLPTTWPSIFGTNTGMILGKRDDIALVTVPDGVDFIVVNGYAAIGDGGAPVIFNRTTSDPGTAGSIASADGAWWNPGTTLLTLDSSLGRAIRNGVGLDIIGDVVFPFLVAAIQYGNATGLLFQVLPDGSLNLFDTANPGSNLVHVTNVSGDFLVNSTIGGTNLQLSQLGNLTITGDIHSGNGTEIGPGSAGIFTVAGTQVVTSRRTGWQATTGAIDRSTFDTGTLTGDAQIVGLRLAALLTDLTTHGLIGA